MTTSSGSQMLEPIVVDRNALYYNTWQYVVLFHLPEASLLRTLDHARIDQTINYRNEWLSRRGASRAIDAQTKSILHQACDYLVTRPNAYKKVVCGNGIWLYTNTPGDFDDLETIPSGRVLYINQAQVTLTPDAVTLKNPRHAFRTYFRERFLGSDELAVLRRYFNARTHLFKPGLGFARLIQGTSMWVQSNYFVDHNEPNADFLINLAVPGIVRKTLPIVARTK
jgi:hypothetical protein